MVEERKLKYRPLIDLLNDESPTPEKVLDAFKRASGKRISLDALGFREKFYKVLDKVNLSSEELKELEQYMKKGVSYSEKRKNYEEKEMWQSLEIYVFRSLVLKRLKEKMSRKLSS